MDIHDQTLADLSDVRRGLERLAVDASCKEPADVIASDLSRAITNLRVVMDNLHPQTLDILGLPAAIESHLEKVCDGPDSPEYHFMASDALNQLTLSKLTQVTLYRVIVEAVHNVLRHAKASILEVNLVRAGKQLVVAVEDNGRGFNFTPSLPGTSGGHGLHNIQERARAIGAQVSWGPSRFTTGTRFELILPISP